MNEVTSFEDFTSEIEQNKWLLVYFTASWCGPCSTFSPVMEKAAGAFSKLLKSIKVDVEQVPRAGETLRIRSVPSLVLFLNGKPVEGSVGAQSFEQVSQWLTRHLLVH